jgi:uncharacterized membrane protein YeaQ/YmgE (transglycosylase-associated protein family)
MRWRAIIPKSCWADWRRTGAAVLRYATIGAVAGWLAGILMKGGGFGLVGDIVVGIIGAFIGGYLASALHISIGTGMISSIITATIGAILLILIVRMVKRA